MLIVGGRLVDPAQARAWVAEYLNGKRGQYGYPSYDGYVTNGDPHTLCDADLLAPVLLNVQVKISSFADLSACRETLEMALGKLPVDVDLADAHQSVLADVGDLFAVLDAADRPRNVLGTTLAKVLHRKRPSLVPLYDEQVRRVYQDGATAPLPYVRGRSWTEFMTRLAGCIRDDLNRDLDFWGDLTQLRPETGPSVSRLRALDIVAWRLGSPAG